MLSNQIHSSVGIRHQPICACIDKLGDLYYQFFGFCPKAFRASQGIPLKLMAYLESRHSLRICQTTQSSRPEYVKPILERDIRVIPPAT